jgi:GH25 family lysozyme M1 (1,4-beta-N-acetylmuramidase)
MPLRRRVLLVDLSNNNPEPIDWHKVRAAGAFGALLKVSEGDNFVDRTWPDRARRARAAGLRVGGYHFARPHGDPLVQATLFVGHLGKVERRDLHPALDLEVNDHKLSPVALYSWAHQFGAHVHAMTGAKVLWYTYPAFLAEQHWHATLATGAGLWIAAYGPNDGRDHGVPAGSVKPWRSYVAHQYTSVGRIAGVTGHVDLSHARSRRAVLAHGLRGLL